MPEEDIKRLLDEVRRSLEHSQKTLKALEERGTQRRSSPPPPPPAPPAPQPSASTSGVMYKRRKTASYDATFLEQPRVPPSPAIPAEAEWGSGERLAATPPAAPPTPVEPSQEANRYAIIQPRTPKKGR